MRFSFIHLLLLCCCLCLSAQTKSAVDSWETKAIDQWDAADVKSILGNSAWGKTLEGILADDSFLGTIYQKGAAKFTLRSALIVRLAQIRNLQLAEKYDAMNSAEKAAFNKKYKVVLVCPLCEKFYIVGVAGDSRILQNALGMNRRSNSIYLSNEKGERRNLQKYSPQTTPGTEALFFFPRYDEKGNALVNADNTMLTFNLKIEPGDDPIVRLLSRVDIKVQDIVRDKTVIF